MINKEQFLPSITTISAKYGVSGNTWQDKIKEIDELGLKKVAIFSTCLNKEQRQEMYGLLKKTGLKEIPFVHIRSDMPAEELDYLAKKFKTKVFNIHSEKQYPFAHNLEKYHKQFFIENAFSSWDEQEIKKFAGLCLDFSHLENSRLLNQERYKHRLDILKKFKIGCNHVGPISKEKVFWPGDSEENYDRHLYSDLSEFDYLKNYPKEFFSNYIAIEVENSLADQLKAIDYIYEICR